MEPSIATPPAPAQPVAAEPTTQTAVDAAVTQSPSDYRAARRAERAGKPLPDVPLPVADPAPAQALAPADPAAPAQPDKAVSKRQQQINDYERRIAEQDQRIRALEAGDRPEPKREPAPAAAKPATVDDTIDRPDISKPRLTEEEFFKQFPEAPYGAYGVYWTNYLLEAKQQTTQQRDLSTQREQAELSRIHTFDDRVKAMEATDPEIASKIAPLAMDLGKRGGPYGIVSQQILDSPIGPQVLLHLQAHPEALTDLVKLPEHLQSLHPSLRVQAHIPWLVKAFGRLEATLDTPSAPVEIKPPPKTISDAPAPVADLGSRASEPADPKAGAIRRGDTRSYRLIRREERRAQLGR